MTTMSIDNHGFLYEIRMYRGFVIQSFNNAQLLDTDCTGFAYTVYFNEAAYRDGVPMNLYERHNKLWQAKAFVDAIIAAERQS